MDIQQLIDELDKKAPGQWEIYRAGLGHWMAKIKLGEQRYEASSDLLGAALAEILEWVPLPVVPRRQPVVHADDCTYERGNSSKQWEIRWGGKSLGPSFPTKKAAQAYAALCADRSTAAYDEWIQYYGWSIDKVEGVDFRYAESWERVRSS